MQTECNFILETSTLLMVIVLNKAANDRDELRKTEIGTLQDLYE